MENEFFRMISDEVHEGDEAVQALEDSNENHQAAAHLCDIL
jgi:hypothetical protein